MALSGLTGVVGGIGGVLLAGGIAYYYRRRRSGAGDDESPSARKAEARDREQAQRSADYAQNREDWAAARAQNRADTKERVKNSRRAWRMSRSGKTANGKDIPAAFADSKGFMAGTDPAGSTDLEKLVGRGFPTVAYPLAHKSLSLGMLMQVEMFIMLHV